MNALLKTDERGDLAIDSIAGAVGAAIVVPTMTALLVGLWSVSSMTGEVTRHHIDLADIANQAVVSGDRFDSAENPTPYGPESANALVWESTVEEGPAAPGVGELDGTELDSTEQYWVNVSGPRQAQDRYCDPADLPDEDCFVVSVPVTNTVGGFAVTEVDTALNASRTTAQFDVAEDPGEIRYTAWLSERCEGTEIVVRGGADAERRALSAGDGAFIYGSVNFIGENGLRVGANNASITVESSCGVTFDDILIYEGPRR